jgi:hypothetical protein
MLLSLPAVVEAEDARRGGPRAAWRGGGGEEAAEKAEEKKESVLEPPPPELLPELVVLLEEERAGDGSGSTRSESVEEDDMEESERVGGDGARNWRLPVLSGGGNVEMERAIVVRVVVAVVVDVVVVGGGGEGARSEGVTPVRPVDGPNQSTEAVTERPASRNGHCSFSDRPSAGKQEQSQVNRAATFE